MAFERTEPGDFADDEIIGRKAPAGARCQIVFNGEEWFDREAAEDAGELIGASEVGSEVLPRHGVGHADKVRGAPRGVAFSGEEDGVGQHALKRTE